MVTGMMWVMIAAGGAFGAMARFTVSGSLTRLLGHGFPYGTMTVNILGSLLMGVLVGWMLRFAPEGRSLLHGFLAIGFLGSFTTFSTFSLDSMLLIERGEVMGLLFYTLLSVIISLLALMAGLSLGRMI